MSNANEEAAGKKPAAKKTQKRRFRLWEKKRGDRQTGSLWWGRAGEVMFFATLFLFGVLALTQLITLRLVSDEEIFLTSNWVMALGGLVLGSLIIVGATGAIYSALLTSTSAERRAAITQRATSRDLLADLRSKSEEYPAVPNDTNWKISPGVRLAYRLPSSSTTSFRTTSLAIFTLAWNAAVLVLAVLEFNLGRGPNLIIREWLSRPGVSLSGVVVAIFTGMGGYLIYRLVRQLVAAEAMGPTQVEVSTQPFLPNEKYRVLVTQLGHLEIAWLELWLACDEDVCFTEGTDTRVESNRVYEKQVFRQEKISIEPSEPYHHETDVDIPEDAMHSFVAAHNSITWKLVVKADSDKWHRIERVFPLIINPAKVVAA